MNIVVDTNILISVLLDESNADAIVNLTTGHHVVAPLSVHYEIGNALVNARRRGRRSSEELHRAIESYLAMEINFLEVDLFKAVEVASVTGLLAYDAYILSCAMEYDFPLMTLDKRLRSAANAMGVKIVEVENGEDPGIGASA